MLTGKDLTLCSIRRNVIQRDNIASTAHSGDIFVGSDTAANTGIIADNHIGHLDPLQEMTKVGRHAVILGSSNNCSLGNLITLLGCWQTRMTMNVPCG